VGFEPTIPVFELAKKVHVLDRTATVTGPLNIQMDKMKSGKMLKSCVTVYALKFISGLL
jgi:hypothetical protein